MTEQAASRVLNATDIAKPIQERIEARAATLHQRWELLFANRLSTEEFCPCVGDPFIPRRGGDDSRATNTQLTEIMMAQDFQDLTGQVIKRVIDLAQRLESQLLEVLIESMPPERKNESASGLLNGPVINADGRDDVVSSRGRWTICSRASGSDRAGAQVRNTARPAPAGRSPAWEYSTMSDFAGMEELLQDFLVEAGDLLSGVDNKLVDLERTPSDRGLLNDIFRGFHTIKGGAGFLNATELVTLCHLTENLFDKLRNGELEITPEAMDVILAATGVVREMFGSLEAGASRRPRRPN